MKKAAFIFAILTLTACATIDDLVMIRPVKHSDRAEILKLIEAKDCKGAEELVYKSVSNQNGLQFLFLGILNADCYGNRSKAIEYLRASAAMGTTAAVGALIELGEKPPQVTARPGRTEPPTFKNNVGTPQQQSHPIGADSLNKCIKDGGSVFCR
jgi:hypothetical protein